MFENDLRKNEQFNTYVINDLNDVSLSFRKPYSIDTDKTTNPWTTTLKNISFFSLVRNCTVTIVGLFGDKCKETEGFSKELDTSNLPALQICGYEKTRKKIHRARTQNLRLPNLVCSLKDNCKKFGPI